MTAAHSAAMEAHGLRPDAPQVLTDTESSSSNAQDAAFDTLGVLQQAL